MAWIAVLYMVCVYKWEGRSRVKLWPIAPPLSSSPLTPCICPPSPAPLQLLVKGPVELWWPAGYGAQPLYNISATFRPSVCSACPCTASTGRSSVSRSDVPPWEEDPNLISEPPCPSSTGSGQQATGDGCSSVQRAIGFRTLELVTDPLKKVSARGAGGGREGCVAWEEGRLTRSRDRG